jgi:hypothetical protein
LATRPEDIERGSPILSLPAYLILFAASGVLVGSLGIGYSVVAGTQTLPVVLIGALISGFQAVAVVSRRQLAQATGSVPPFLGQACALVIQVSAVLLLAATGVRRVEPYLGAIALMFSASTVFDRLLSQQVTVGRVCRPSELRGSFTSGGLLHMMVNRSDVIVVGAALGTAPAGVYAIALAVAQPVQQLGQVIAAREAPRVVGKTASSLVKPSVSLVVTCVGAMAVSQLAIPLLFGIEYSGARVPGLILCAGALMQVSQLRLTYLAIAAGGLRPIEMAEGAGLVAMTASVALLGSILGLYGAAIGSVLGYLVRLGALYAWLTFERGQCAEDLVRSDRLGE